MTRLLFLSLGASALMLAVAAAADAPPATEADAPLATADCLLEVDGLRTIDGPCRFAPFLNGDLAGSFTLTSDAGFAGEVVIVGPGVAEASWTGVQPGEQRTASLGRVVPSGACWIGLFAPHVRLCAWPLGQPRRLKGEP
jgi:hypothetical protein